MLMMPAMPYETNASLFRLTPPYGGVRRSVMKSWEKARPQWVARWDL